VTINGGSDADPYVSIDNGSTHAEQGTAEGRRHPAHHLGRLDRDRDTRARRAAGDAAPAAPRAPAPAGWLPNRAPRPSPIE
jgi:hypothetical protein